MDAMHLAGKSILCGRKGRAQYFAADICRAAHARCPHAQHTLGVRTAPAGAWRAALSALRTARADS